MNGHMRVGDKIDRAMSLLKSTKLARDKYIGHINSIYNNLETSSKIKKKFRIKFFRLKEQTLRRMMSAKSAFKSFFSSYGMDPKTIKFVLHDIIIHLDEICSKKEAQEGNVQIALRTQILISRLKAIAAYKNINT